jgi:hydrogenase maturation factor
MTPAVSESKCSPETGCITCGDVAVPLTVMLLDVDRGLALCRDEWDRRETVEIALVGPVAVGDELLVHAGTAIAHLGHAVHPGAPGREAEEATGSCL